MVARYGLDVVHAYMGHVQQNAAVAVGNVITALSDGTCDYELDGGGTSGSRSPSTSAAKTATIDFTGTSPQLGGNFNARQAWRWPPCLRLPHLVDKDIPLNAGYLKPLTVVIPPGTMLPPEYPAAVAAAT